MTHAPDARGEGHELPELRLKAREDRRLEAGHLWIFSNEVDTDRTPLAGFVLSVDEETASRYAAIHDHLRRQGTPIPINDIWIAATAAQHGLRLVTLDRHFLDVPQVPVDFIELTGPAR